MKASLQRLHNRKKVKTAARCAWPFTPLQESHGDALWRVANHKKCCKTSSCNGVYTFAGEGGPSCRFAAVVCDALEYLVPRVVGKARMAVPKAMVPVDDDLIFCAMHYCFMRRDDSVRITAESCYLSDDAFICENIVVDRYSGIVVHEIHDEIQGVEGRTAKRRRDGVCLFDFGVLAQYSDYIGTTL